MAKLANKLTLKLSPANKIALQQQIKNKVQKVVHVVKNDKKTAAIEKPKIKIPPFTQKQYDKILSFLQAQYPKCFTGEFRPLVIGIHKKIYKLHKDILNKVEVKRFFAKYCRNPEYLKVHKTGVPRIDLDGSSGNTILKEQVEKLRNTLQLKKKNRIIKAKK